ncbi:hypothetical protein GCM10007962_22500 [Yeosuana aromativorans]|uniref:Uncharacterized protein n=1 Tax=Yeosuana aromativorans TaxID=288019 RepID=A0A8J3BTT8_9FLAO|nr:hypothetical protein [Yeosuana aromativorans]GGK27742.1 hypothetical protein GCM10007962_22500 [Yeosuana aromativorans]
MKKTIQNLVTIITIVAGIVAVLSFIYQIKSNDPKLEVLEISNDNLTNLPKVEYLKSNFYYKDSLITNLWKLNAIVRNIGSKTIIGKGDNKNIIDNNLTFRLNNGFKLIDFNITQNDFPYNIRKDENIVSFDFVQWRENEKVDITIYAEQVSKESNELKIILNEREIIDGHVNYRKLSQEEDKNKIIADFLPKPIRNVLYWVGIVFYGLIILILPFGLYTELNKYFAYKKWKKNWQTSFNEKMSEFLANGTIDKHMTTSEVPYRIWEKMEIPIPDIPSNPIWSMILGILFAFVLLSIPIIWMIQI